VRLHNCHFIGVEYNDIKCKLECIFDRHNHHDSNIVCYINSKYSADIKLGHINSNVDSELYVH
jgi:hypothetical protein